MSTTVVCRRCLVSSQRTGCKDHGGQGSNGLAGKAGLGCSCPSVTGAAERCERMKMGEPGTRFWTFFPFGKKGSPGKTQDGRESSAKCQRSEPDPGGKKLGRKRTACSRQQVTARRERVRQVQGCNSNDRVLRRGPKWKAQRTTQIDINRSRNRHPGEGRPIWTRRRG
jgi:hypothetical protein